MQLNIKFLLWIYTSTVISLDYWSDKMQQAPEKSHQQIPTADPKQLTALWANWLLTQFIPSNFRGINLSGPSNFQCWGRKTGAPTK